MATIAEWKSRQDLLAYEKESIAYIEKMALISHTNIETWDIDTVFRDATGRIMQRKSDINARLLSAEQEFDAVLDSEVLSTSLEEESKAILKEAAESYIHQFKEQLRQTNNDLLILRRKMKIQEVKAIKTVSIIQRLEENPVNIESEISKVRNDGFWKLIKIEGTELHFINRRDFILTEKNAAANLDIQVNLGQILIAFYPMTLSLTAHRFKNNVVVDSGNYHPYIGRNGNICWGDSDSNAQKLITEYKFAAVFEMLALMLSRYNPEATPYVSLQKFNTAAQHLKKIPPAAEIPF